MTDNQVKIGIYTFKKDEKDKIGEGQFGKVYLGKKQKTDEDVCVKVFKKAEAFGENVLETINQKEIDLNKSMIKIEHENLVKTLDVDDSQEKEAYIVMELCNSSLSEFCKKQPFQKQKNMLDFIYQVTNGYYHLEEHNIVHRDMKPDNILVKQNKEAKVVFKIADFGLGKLLENDTRDMKTKNVGTSYYMAPEIANSSLYSSKCDIFSFGIIIFEMLAGPKTFNPQVNREKLKNTTFAELFKNNLQKVDQWLQQLLNCMLVYDQTKRIGWKDLKTIIDLNMNEKYRGVLGRITENNIFFGQLKDEKITVKIFQKEDDQGNKREFQFREPYSPADLSNAIRINEIINQPNQPLIYVIMEGCDCSLQTMMENNKEFTSEGILDLIYQISNGQMTTQRLASKQVFAIAMSNILVKNNGSKINYKLTNYEYYEIKQANKQFMEPLATVHQLSWIVYQLMQKIKIEYHVFKQDMKDSGKILEIMKKLDQNAQSLIKQMMTTEENCKLDWKSLDLLINQKAQDQKPQTQPRFQSLLPSGQQSPSNQQLNNQQHSNKPQFANIPAMEQPKQIPQFQSPTSNIPKQTPLNFNQPKPAIQQQPQSKIFQAPNANPPSNVNFNQSAQHSFVPNNNPPPQQPINNFPQQNSNIFLQQNNNNFPQQINNNFNNNFPQQNINPLRFGTQKPAQPPQPAQSFGQPQQQQTQFQPINNQQNQQQKGFVITKNFTPTNK